MAVLALYQDRGLRPDTRRLIDALRALGAYVVTVAAAGDGETGADLALKRVNYGRDFGSYRDAILHLDRQGGLADLPRLLLMNDSVFVSGRDLDGFLGSMLGIRGAAPDVLGAVDSAEIAPHLPSFAVSLGPKVLRNAAFEGFWRRFRPSDLRQTTIRKGELALSRCLAAIAPLQALHSGGGPGNPMHTNPAGLLAAGLPLIKLDGVYRGRFDTAALDRICAALPACERQEYLALATARPPAMRTLTGWQREAFRAGLI